MRPQFNSLLDLEGLDGLLNNSNDRPVVVFKHSNSCWISAAAYREMEQLTCEVVVIEVQTAGIVSRELAARTGIRHESPQVIVFRNGKAVWNASHFDVKAQTITEILQTHT